MIVAGLTGGIATGKSTVSAILKQAGSKIIDADKIARMAVEKGTPAWDQIVDAFGSRILTPDKEIDRPALGEIIFHDRKKQRLLNDIVHPFVMAEINLKIKACSPGMVVVLDVPLLIETDMHQDLSELIVVYIPEALQLRRLMARDHLTRTRAMARIRSQMPIDEKKDLASIVIDNSHSIEKTKTQTIKVYEYLVKKIQGHR